MHRGGRYPKLWRASHVAKSLPQISPTAYHRFTWIELSAIHGDERQHDGDKAQGIEREHQPTPTVAIKSPATAGPTARATLTKVEFRLTALRRASAPTISRTND